MWNKMNIGTKFAAITLALLLVYGAAIVIVSNTVLTRAINREKEVQIKEVVTLGLGVLEHYHQRESADELSRQEAQEQAKAAIRAMLFGERKLDYLWINDFDYIQIVHPLRPDLEGKDLSGLTDPDGVMLLKEFVAACKKKRRGVRAVQMAIL